MSYLIVIQVGTDSREEAEEVAREAADDGRITKVTLAEEVNLTSREVNK